MLEFAVLQATAPAVADTAVADAIEARRSGRTDQSIAALEELSRKRPADADVWLNLGLSYGAAGRFEEAERALATALRLAPDYADAQLAYARMAWFRGQPETARARLAPLLARSPPDPEAQALAAQLSQAASAQAVQPWRLDLSYGRSFLTGGLPDWQSGAVAVGRRLGGGRSTTASLEFTERFGAEDIYLEAAAAKATGRGGEVYLAIGGAPGADHRPEVALRGGASRAFVPGGDLQWLAGVDLAWRRFPVGDVSTVQPWLSFTWRGATTVTVRAVNTLDERDEYRSGYAVRAERAVHDRLRLSAAWADAPESSEGVTVEVRAATLGVALDLDASQTLRLDATREMRSAYDRDELSLAFTRRF